MSFGGFLGPGSGSDIATSWSGSVTSWKTT